MVSNTNRIIKISNSKGYVDYPQQFSPIDQLYLELIENKSKIKQNLINKDYQPTNKLTLTSIPQSSFKQPPLNQSFLKNDKYSVESVKSDISEKSNISINTEKSEKSDKTEKNNKYVEQFDKLDKLDRYENLEKYNRNKSVQSVHSSKTEKTEKTERTEKSERTHISEKTDDTQDKPHKNILENKLHNLLSKKESNNISSSNEFEEYQRSRKRLPTLSELEQQGIMGKKQEFADGSRINIEDEDLKREMLFKFDLLRKSYKEQTIPTYTIHTDLNLMKKSYDDTVKRLSLDNSVENYKKYMIGGFMVIEYCLGKFLKFDMKGYTQQQIVQMSTYEKLLIELGEKTYVPEGKKWSVELRLVFIVIIQTAFFIVGKMIFNNTGSNIMNAINSMNSANSKNHEQPKKKMQGPTINLDDLPDVSDF